MLADRDVEGVDPHGPSALFQTQNVLANVYEGLVARDGDLRVGPALAVSWSNPDDHTWEFVLRDGVRFHDGSLLTADDVVASMLRARGNPRSAAQSALVGVEEVLAPRPGVVRLRTREPEAALLSRLPAVPIASAAWTARVDRGEQAPWSAGTGPFAITAYRPGDMVQLERFPSYWGTPPPLKVVRVLPFPFGSPQADARVAPDDLVTFFAAPDSPAFARARDNYDLRTHPGVAVQYLGFDLRDRDTPGVRVPSGRRGNPFRDRRVREAVAAAIDYDRLTRAALGGATRVATQLVAPEVLGFDPSLPPPRRDIAAARRLLAQTPWAAGFDVDLDTRELVAPYVPPVVDGLAELGIRVRVVTHTEEQFLTQLTGRRSSLYLLRFTSRTGDAQELLDKIVHSRDEARGYGTFAFSYEASPLPEVDRLIEDAHGLLDPAQRMALLQRILGLLAAQHLFVPLRTEPTLVFVSRGLRWTARADGFRLFAEMIPEP